MGDRLVLFHVMETICTKIFIAFLYFKMGHWTQKPSSCVKQSFIEEELANETESGMLSFYISFFTFMLAIHHDDQHPIRFL